MNSSRGLVRTTENRKQILCKEKKYIISLEMNNKRGDARKLRFRPQTFSRVSRQNGETAVRTGEEPVRVYKCVFQEVSWKVRKETFSSIPRGCAHDCAMLPFRVG